MVATSHTDEQKHSSLTSNSNFKYLAPLVAEVHPEQSNMTTTATGAASTTYKSPSTLSSSASLPTSVSTPFCASQSASSTAAAATAVIPSTSTYCPTVTIPIQHLNATNGSVTTVALPSAALPPLRSHPADWSIEEVIQFIETNDSSLAVHGDLFRKHVSCKYFSFFLFLLVFQ